VRTGAFERGERLERATQPRSFWLRVARVLLVGASAAAAFVLSALRAPTAAMVGLITVYVVGFVLLSVLQVVPGRRDLPGDRVEP